MRLYLYVQLSSDVAPSRAPIHPSVQTLAELKEPYCPTALEEASYRKRVHDGRTSGCSVQYIWLQAGDAEVSS